MPPLPPATGDDVVDLIRKAELADDDALSAFVGNSGLPSPSPADTATRLIQAGILTPFQAKLILRGKYKGFRLGQYRILDQIGGGGMGQVFLAEHVRLQRRVALKVLPAHEAANPAELERFYREARAVATLDHPNIVRAFDIDHDNKTHFLVMEYLEGVTLAEHLARSDGAVPCDEACALAIQVAAGLEHAHERHVVHRDIKPGNLLLTNAGLVKILDMGISRFFREPGGADLGTPMGTTDYLPPEQANACERLDHRADVYSLGATLYHLVTGRPPFEGTTAAKLIAHQLNAVPPAHSVNPAVPDELSAVIERMMAKSPSDRYDSATDVIHALAPFASEIPGYTVVGGTGELHVRPQSAATAAPSGSFFRRNRARLLYGSLVVLSVIGGVIGWNIVR